MTSTDFQPGKGNSAADDIDEGAKKLVTQLHLHYAGQSSIKIQELERTKFLPGAFSSKNAKGAKAHVEYLHEAFSGIPTCLSRRRANRWAFIDS